jgi:hypothetical protein
MPDLPLVIPAGCPVPPSWPPPEDWWDLVVVALSNGKDSRAVLHDAVERYPRRRTIALYNHLGNEHEGSEVEAAALCQALEVPLLFTWKERRDGRLVSCYGPEVPEGVVGLDLVVELAAARGQWADRANPLCTSTGKRDTSDVVVRGDDPSGRASGRGLVAHLALDRGRWPSREFPPLHQPGQGADDGQGAEG